MVVHEKLMRKLIEPTSLSRSLHNSCNRYEFTSRDSLGPGACPFSANQRARRSAGPSDDEESKVK
jgi:hypothetical protein